VVHGAGKLHAGLAFDTSTALRNDWWDVQHSAASWPKNRGSGERDDYVPKLFGRDVQLQLHRWDQHWFVRNHHLKQSRPSTTRMRVMKLTSELMRWL
jgi:hypothetical protein